MLGVGLHRGLEVAGTVGFHTFPTPFGFFFLRFPGIAAKAPLYGSPLAARGRGFCGGAPCPSPAQPLQHRVELGGGQGNWEGRDLGSLESGQMGSLRNRGRALESR